MLGRPERPARDTGCERGVPVATQQHGALPQPWVEQCRGARRQRAADTPTFGQRRGPRTRAAPRRGGHGQTRHQVLASGGTPGERCSQRFFPHEGATTSDDRHQGPLRRHARLQERRKVAGSPQLGDVQLQAVQPCVERLVAVALADGALRRALVPVFPVLLTALRQEFKPARRVTPQGLPSLASVAGGTPGSRQGRSDVHPRRKNAPVFGAGHNDAGRRCSTGTG